MRKISLVFALLTLFFADLVLANAVATTVTGTAQAQRGSAAARSLRQGDEVVQGDTVFTGPNSSIVLRFDDGQIAALTSNSRMTITAYQFSPQSGSGNVLLSLIHGGMRALTGLIGHNSPDRVSYRAATATIGIRGSEAMLVTIEGKIVVIVTEGAISMTFGGQTLIVPAGEGVNALTDGTFQQAAAEQILQQVSPDIANAIGGLQGLTNAINQAASSGTKGPAGNTTTPATPAGGGAPSPS